jgi:hypothetical protein
LLVATVGAAVPASAQRAPADSNFVKMLFSALFSPNWTVYANAGAATSGRMLLQTVTGGQRSLRAEPGFTAGGGAGVDLLPRAGFRINYAYAKHNLEFRDDNGTGSSALDLDDIGSMNRNTVSLEGVTYMFPHEMPVTPYATLGVLGTWWSLNQDGTAIVTAGGETQFTWGALASLGLQFRLNRSWAMRTEWSGGGLGNPFTGKRSFRATSGVSIDEPTRVDFNDYRFVVAYSFGKKATPMP